MWTTKLFFYFSWEDLTEDTISETGGGVGG